MSDQIKLYNHPTFKKDAKDFQVYRDLYEGDQHVMKDKKYLWLHELERKPEGRNIRTIREQRSAYTNFIEPIVSIWTSLFFRKEPTVDQETEAMLGDYLYDIDGKGTSLFAFIRDEILRTVLLYGRPLLKVSALGDRPETKADESQSYRPYFELIEPLSFVDWQQEMSDPQNLNKLLFARVEYQEMPPRLTAQDEPTMQIVSKEYLLVDGKLQIRKYKAVKDDKKEQDNVAGECDSQYTWILIDIEELNEWDEIPIVANLAAESWIKDAAPHVLKYYNLESVIDNIALFQAHQRVYFIGDLPKDTIIAAAEYAYNTLPEGTSISTIEPTNTASIETRLALVLNNIFRIALNQVRQMNADSAAAQSAETMREERDNTVAVVESEIESIENIVNQGLRLWAKYLGNDSFNGKVSLKQDISKNDIDNAIKLTLAFRDQIAKLPMINKALLNWFVDEMDLDNKEELKEEIKTMQIQAPEAPQLGANFIRGLQQAQQDEENE